MPFSLIWVSGATLSTVPAPDDGAKPVGMNEKNFLTNTTDNFWKWGDTVWI